MAPVYSNVVAGIAQLT